MELWVQLLLSGIGCLLTLIGTLFVLFLKGIRADLSVMTGSVERLNNKIAVVINDQQWHKEEIEEIKIRLQKVEEQ